MCGWIQLRSDSPARPKYPSKLTLWKTLFKFNVLCVSKSVYPDPAFNLRNLDSSEDLESFPFSLLSGSEEERRIGGAREI